MAAQTTTAKSSLAVVDRNTAPLRTILEILARDGGVIVHNMLSHETVSKLRSELDPTSEATSVGPQVDNQNVNYFGENRPSDTRDSRNAHKLS